MADLKDLFFREDEHGIDEKVDGKNIYDQLKSVVGKTSADQVRDEINSLNRKQGRNFEMPEVPFIPPNPIDKTNEEIVELHSTIRTESLKNSKSISKWNRGMLLISLIALITSAVFSILAFNSSNQSSNRLEKLIIEQNRLLKSYIEVNEVIKNNSNKTLVSENSEKI